MDTEFKSRGTTAKHTAVGAGEKVYREKYFGERMGTVTLNSHSFLLPIACRTSYTMAGLYITVHNLPNNEQNKRGNMKGII